MGWNRCGLRAGLWHTKVSESKKIPTRLVALWVCVLCAYAAIRMYCSTLIRNLISIS